MDDKAIYKALIESRAWQLPVTGFLLASPGCFLMDRSLIDTPMAEGSAEIMVCIGRPYLAMWWREQGLRGPRLCLRASS